MIIDQRPPPPPLQPPRTSVSCDRHPHDNFTGFCPTCLCERLTILDQSATATATTASSSSRRNSISSSTTAAVKAIFRSNATSEDNRTKLTTESSSLLDLRRTKSFSASKNEALGFFTGVFEHQRKSCDARGRNTLSSLFSIDDDDSNPGDSSTQQQTIGSTDTVLETNKEDDEEYEDGDEIRVSEEQEVRRLDDLENDIVEMEAEIDAIVNNLKSMKDHIDLDSQSKKPSLSNFWSAASVLSKKWQKWRRNQKKNVDSSRTLPVQKKPISRNRRETLSEIADYGFGRRSCDLDPRFSLDAGRISVDDRRYSFDEPRASWDGYLIGRSFPRLPPMVEDVPVVHPPRSDMQIPVEEPTNSDNIPGGSIQTRDFYLDSSSNSKRRKSVDRSNSIRKIAAAVVAEMDERKTTTTVSNAKVSPDTIDWNHIHGRPKFRSIGGENELERESFSNSLRDDGSATFDLGFRDTVNKEAKKSRWWRWKVWGFINGQAANRGSEGLWQDSRSNGNGESRDGFNRKLYRSSSSVSWRNSSYKMKKSSSAENDKNRKEGDEFVFERNRSARYSPNHVNNGLLRFYLTPLRGSRRTGTAKSRLSSNSNSIDRNMLQLY